MSDRCPAWSDGEHMFSPGFLVTRYHPSGSGTILGYAFKDIDKDDHRTTAKRCQCGATVKLDETKRGVQL